MKLIFGILTGLAIGRLISTRHHASGAGACRPWRLLAQDRVSGRFVRVAG